MLRTLGPAITGRPIVGTVKGQATGVEAMIDLLRKWADDRGYEIAWGPADVVAEACEAIARRRRAGEFDGEFDRERLSIFRYPELLPFGDCRTVVLVAVPRPAHTVIFELADGPFSALVPPTYVAYSVVKERVRRDLASNVFRGEFRLEILPAPLKAIAARLGLVRYGRNNITYTERFGSYYQLVGLVTDADLPPSLACGWAPPELMSICASCEVCIRACPTGAIESGRVLLHAERCLVYHNESPRPWPENLSPAAHHCLVGCVRCQTPCPANKGLLELEPGKMSFSVDETAAILSSEGTLAGPIGDEVMNKLKGLAMEHYAPMLGRNLRALLKRRTRKHARPRRSPLNAEPASS